MKCMVCGNEISENCAFCGKCGSEVKAMKAALPDTDSGFQQSAEPQNPAAAGNMAPISPAANAAYGQPVPQPVFFDDNSAPIVTTGHWLITFLLLLIIPAAAAFISGIIAGIFLPQPSIIPSLIAVAVSFIMMFIWAFNSRTNPSKRNCFRAMLIYTAILLVLIIVLAVVLGSWLINNFSSIDEFMDMFMHLTNI